MTEMAAKQTTDWIPREYQEAVLMCGSKTAFQKYLGIDQTELKRIWTLHNLLTPMEYLNTRNLLELSELTARFNSLAKAAEHLGVSMASFGKAYATLAKMQKRRESLTPSQIEYAVVKYKSVRLAARMFGIRESELRIQAREQEVDLMPLIDYSQSNWHNGKGRRAELDYIAYREGQVTEDCNLTKGSQAEDYDCVDAEYGKVQVKASRQYRYKAKTRSESPFYWKFSTHATQKADTVALMMYDKDMKELTHVLLLKADSLKDYPNSVTVIQDEGEFKCLKQPIS